MTGKARLLVTAPLACASFLFFHGTKWLFHNLRKARTRGHESLRWQTLSEILHQPLALPYIMVTGPRWNTHAIIAGAGPFQVRESIEIQLEVARSSAAMSTVVVYAASDSSTVASIDPHNLETSVAWHKQGLEPGWYSLILRYYEWTANAVLPEVRIDGERQIPGRSISAQENDYLDELRQHTNAFYLCLQYYVYHLLNYRSRLPESFVRKEFLPVGNPETNFLYGPVARAQRLEINSSMGLPEGYRLYLTLYNKASFPLRWCEVRHLPYRTEPLDTDGWYLLRCHCTGTPKPEQPGPENIHVSVT